MLAFQVIYGKINVIFRREKGRRTFCQTALIENEKKERIRN